MPIGQLYAVKEKMEKEARGMRREMRQNTFQYARGRRSEREKVHDQIENTVMAMSWAEVDPAFLKLEYADDADVLKEIEEAKKQWDEDWGKQGEQDEQETTAMTVNKHARRAPSKKKETNMKQAVPKNEREIKHQRELIERLDHITAKQQEFTTKQEELKQRADQILQEIRGNYGDERERRARGPKRIQ